MCEVPGCFVRPSFKFPVRGAASQRCARHKLPGMVGNSGKLTARDSTLKPGDILEPKYGDDEVKAATPKRVRGELLRIQREQMMQIIDKTSTHDLAESMAKTASSPQLATSGTSIKRMKHFLANQNANEVDQRQIASSDCINAGAEGSQQQVRMNKLGVAAAAPQVTPDNSASSETVHTAATTDRRVSNSSIYLGVRPSDCIFPENLTSFFSQLQGVPFSMATAPAADFTSQLAFHAATLPVNLNMPCQLPCRARNTTDFNQTLLALNPAMWCPPVAPSYPFSAPFVPNLTPWAAAALSMSLNLDYTNNPSLLLNNPAALLTNNWCSQFAQNTAATLPTISTSSYHQSMAGFSAMQNQPNVAPNHVGVSSNSKLE
jgi:hypothetical protein